MSIPYHSKTWLVSVGIIGTWVTANIAAFWLVSPYTGLLDIPITAGSVLTGVVVVKQVAARMNKKEEGQ